MSISPGLALGTVVVTVVAMEGAATAIHRYVMHGWGWGWHRSHHEPSHGRLERNDLYALLFGLISLGLFIAGERWPILWWVGLGTLVYGLLYFLVHDGLVHRRVPLPRMKPAGYLKRLVQAHRLHHAVREREGAVSFGFLYAPPVQRLLNHVQRFSAMIVPHQSAKGLLLAALIIGGWLTLHIWGVFVLSVEEVVWIAAPVLIALICWLNVGMFIVAHDAMHGSLAPGRPRVNRIVGRTALLLYAGFLYDRLIAEHMAHHRDPGTTDDPDFSVEHPSRFWPWYIAFFRHYFGWQQLLFLTAVTLGYLALGANYVNILLFWALPAILSSLQLFYFGTYLPHRHAEEPFADRHNARTNHFGWLASLLSCFHFGYHHEHHLAPHIPWWRLPEERRRSIAR